MLKITLVIAVLLQGVFLRAQDCECYAPTRQTAVRMMEKKEYAKALKLLRAADACPDKPSDNDLADKMQECRRAIQRIEEEQRKAREGEARGYMEILDIEFSNEDENDKTLTPYGGTLYAQEMKYLIPRLRYNGLATEDKTVRLFFKIITPSGALERGQSSPEGFTYSYECTVKPGTNQNLVLSGWGNNNGGSYQEGTHRFELYYNGRKLYAKEFEVLKKEETIYLTVDGKTAVSTSFSADGGRETFYISTNAASWDDWGVPRWCTIFEKGEKSFKLVVDANPERTERTDYMLIKAGGKEVRIDIRQEAKTGPSATINRVWVDHNTTKTIYENKYYPYLGWQQIPTVIYVMKIHVDFDVSYMKNKMIFVCAFFYDQNGEKMRASNNQYRTPDGQVTVQSKANPTYEHSTWSDFVLEIPYSVMTKGSNKFSVKLYDDSGNFMTSSDYEYFSVQ